MNRASLNAAARQQDVRIRYSPSPWANLWPISARSAGMIFLAWTVVGFFQFLPGIVNGLSWPFVASKLIEAWAWAILTPAILIIDHKLAWAENSIGKIVIIFALLSIPFTVGHTYLSAIIQYPISQIWWSPFRNENYTIYYFMASWQMFCAVAGILQALKYHNDLLENRLELERTEKTLIESRLNALRLQLEPHFLFNALNAISSDVTTNPRLARDMLENLGALLRSSLDCKERAEISLAQELELLEHYLSIQRVRFGDRLEIKIDAAPEALSMLVPSMLLQPLVENAIRHGIDGRISGGTIVIAASPSSDYLDIRVLDDGVGLPHDWRLDDSTGIGVRVTRERLAALYPESAEYCLTIGRRATGGTEVAIRIPLHRSESDGHEATV
ncbi:sensor histidine kinase [Hephaestia mangrovi]|uniref:sensor histidine kinase n=1 Tax=Hephaestia mangrovi TaxID=2873268 RepID=UPI001CA73209|nr:histidine kinase [Hephaestia mangrovi]MBY8827408.1 histidine kinase [Hephaestia mangrovi]